MVCCTRIACVYQTMNLYYARVRSVSTIPTSYIPWCVYPGTGRTTKKKTSRIHFFLLFRKRKKEEFKNNDDGPLLGLPFFLSGLSCFRGSCENGTSRRPLLATFWKKKKKYRDRFLYSSRPLCCGYKWDWQQVLVGFLCCVRGAGRDSTYLFLFFLFVFRSVSIFDCSDLFPISSRLKGSGW